MVSSDQQVFEVEHPSDVARVVISVRRLCSRLGFSATDGTLISTAASELATNIVRYAGEGRIRIEELHEGRSEGIAITAEDEGPGIADLDRAVESEYSSGNSLGLGLPSVQRIMDCFEIESELGTGTVVRTSKWRQS